MRKLYAVCFILSWIWIPYPTNAQTQVTFHTNYGEFIVELYDSLMPITAGNFKDLVEQEFYDGVIFHRVIDNFVIQGGDPTGTGSGGPGYTIPDEFDSTLSNLKQTISMANSGPNTGGSQFFINLVDNDYLDFDNPPLSSAHPIFGIVTEGFEIVDSIGEAPVDGANRPLDDVVMDSLRVILPPDTAVAIPEISAKKDISIEVFPNPVSDKSVLSIKTTLTGQVDVAIYNHMGVLVYKFTGTQRSGGNGILLDNPAFDLALFQPGMFFIVVSNDHQTAVRKFMVAR